MTSNFAYYIFCILAVVIGFLIVKRIASCMIKTVVAVIIIAAIAAIYFMYIK